jgi:hypothetical protein
MINTENPKEELYRASTSNPLVDIYANAPDEDS